MRDKMSKHTPGPWQNVLYDLGNPVAHAGNYLVMGPDDDAVLDPRCGPNRSAAEVKANGDLAAAAPDLLAALDNAIFTLAAVAHYLEQSNNDEAILHANMARVHELRGLAAVKKARGEAQDDE